MAGYEHPAAMGDDLVGVLREHQAAGPFMSASMTATPTAVTGGNGPLSRGELYDDLSPEREVTQAPPS